MRRRSLLRKDDSGISEVVGFILTFAISAIFLMVSMTTFWTARNNSDAVITAVEMRSIADRVASRIVQAGLFAQEFPNATLEFSMVLPQDLNGHPYRVSATEEQVNVVSIDGTISASATTFKLDATGVSVTGSVVSSEERLIVTYSTSSGQPTISIRT